MSEKKTEELAELVEMRSAIEAVREATVSLRKAVAAVPDGAGRDILCQVVYAVDAVTDVLLIEAWTEENEARDALAKATGEVEA